MMRLLRQLTLLQQQGHAASTRAAHHLSPAVGQQCGYQTALEQTSPSEAGDHSSGQSEHVQHRAWAPERSLPPPSYYGVQVIIRAHDLKFVKLASTVVRDLALVNFAPKSREAVPEEMRRRQNLPWVNLAMPIGDAALPTRRKHWTVIRGPHVHKSSREQFARITHQRLIEYSTNNLSELNWFLDSIKLYKFIGVELTVKITSNSYLLPTTSEQQAAAEQPLLLQHKQRFAHLFGAAAPSSNGPGLQEQQQDGHSSSPNYAALQQSMQGLRQSVREGLLQQRVQLASNSNFKQWQNKGKTAAAPAAAVSSTSSTTSAVQDLVAQQLQGSDLATAEGAKHQQAFLAAVDKALLQMKVDVLDRHKFFPHLMAFYKLGQQKTPPAEWMHAMLKYGKMRQQEAESSAAAAALETYQQYGQVTQTLLMQMLQQWYQEADKQSRQELALPDQELTQNLLELGASRAGRGKQAGQSVDTAQTVSALNETSSESSSDEEFDQEVAAQYADDEEQEKQSSYAEDAVGSRGGRGFGRVDRFRPDGGGSDRVDRYTPDK